MMQPLTRISSRAVHLPEPNIDTDALFPARYLLLMERKGLGEYLFRDRRFRADGTPIPGFPLDAADAQGAQIIIGGPSFGCGSSREQAVWALYEYGIRCVLAPDFGDIFANNCAKNGLLASRMPASMIEALGAQAQAGAIFDIDLDAREIRAGDITTPLNVSDNVRSALLNGWDDTDIILTEDGARIAAFELEHKKQQPWLFEQTN
ncbi:MAG: leuD [Hyphomicrobiales bacterium]|jgi:3-isopropylmalate/(R)-2-methylmalate dehydratase small subunit|nr:leuD [Hyphomicrobiales bacterium]